MNIAIIAEDSKKELMVQFCIAYCGILSKHSLCATATTGKIVSESTGLKINCYLSGVHGGNQQIISRIACNEIDMVLFFRNPLTHTSNLESEDSISLIRICDVHSIPIATNIATAEMLIHGLERGDLDWRELYH